MQVMIFTEVISPYICGISSYVDVLKKGLEKLGHNVLIVTSDTHVTDAIFRSNVIFLPAKKSNNIYGYECSLEYLNPKELGFIKKFKPDIIHIHTDTKIGYLGLFVADALDLPVVFTIHDYFNDRFASEKRLTWRLKTRIEKQHFLDMIDNAEIITSSCSRASSFVNTAGRNCKVKMIQSNTDSVRFDYRGVSPSDIKATRTRYGLSPTACIAIFAGGLSVDKNLEFILTSFAKNIKPKDNIQLLIVGDGTETAHLKKLTQKLRIQEMVFFIGAQSHSIMPGIYSACDIYVCSSEDGLMSMSCLEAISCGLPVLIKEDKEEYVYNMIKNGVNGFVYNSQSDFVKYLKKFSTLNEKNKGHLRRLVRSTLKDTKDTEMADKYIQTYKEAVKIRRMRRNS